MKKWILAALLVLISLSALSPVFAGGPNCVEGELTAKGWFETSYTVIGVVGPNDYEGRTTCEISYPNRLGAYMPQIDIETDRWYNTHVPVPSVGTIVTHIAVVELLPGDSEYSLVGIDPAIGKPLHLPEDHRVVDGRWRLSDVFVTDYVRDGGYLGSVKLWIDNKSGDTFAILPDGKVASIALIDPAVTGAAS